MSFKLYDETNSYCDWRITFSCKDGQIYKSLYTLNLAIVILVTIACIILLWYRMGRQGCTIFSPKIPGAGLIRPNPIEGFLVWAILWLIGRTIFILILWSGILTDKYLALETLQELYWTSGSTGCAWFVVGTYLQIGSHLNSRQRPWSPNNKLSDEFLIIITIGAPMTIWPLTILSGYYRDNKNVKAADLLITSRYLLWGFWCGFGALGAYYFGKELCNILSYHISVAKENDNITPGRLERMRSGLEKIKFTIYIILSTYIYYFIYCIINSLFRIWIISHSEILNILLFVTYAFLNPLCIIIVVTTISIRIIQGCKKGSPKELIDNDTCNNRNSHNIKKLRNTNAHLAISIPTNNSTTANELEKEIPRLDSITSVNDQMDDLVAYTQLNTNILTYDVKRNVSNISGSDLSELNDDEKNHDIRQSEQVVVRPASPTIPIFPINQKY